AGLQVTMEKSAAMRIVERVGDRCADLKNKVNREWAALEARLERAARDVLHDKEFAAVQNVEVEDRGDTGVRQSRKHQRLTLESLPALCIANCSAQQHLDRNIAIEVDVVGFPD